MAVRRFDAIRPPDLVEDAQSALARADWTRARECFELALEHDAQLPEALDGLGRALHFQGEWRS